MAGSQTSVARRAFTWSCARPGWPLGLLGLAVHLYASGGYGIFRDELYFIVCGGRPDWGYVDQPPLVPLVAAAMHQWFPGALTMLRLLPAAVHAATVVLAADTARRLGGGAWAQALAGLSVLSAGIFLALGTILSADVLQPVAWLLCSWLMIRLVRTGDPRWWLAIGGVAAVALWSKYTIAFWIAALAVGLLATPARRSLATIWPYLAGALCVLALLPNLWWQAAHDWPFLEFAHAIARGKNVALSPLGFLGAQLRLLNPGTSPVWIAGLAAFALWPRFADLRGFAVAVLLLGATMVALHGKPYYMVGAVPVLMAGGAVALEAGLRHPAARGALTALVALVGLAGAPFVLPVLPIERFAAYQMWLGEPPHPEENRPLGRLPQLYADMFGWSTLAQRVGEAYQSLPEPDRAWAVFFADNYGEAAAVDVLGGPWGVPPAVSGHNSYYLWGPRGLDGSVVILLGGTRAQRARLCGSVDARGVVDDPWAMPDEAGRTVWICRNAVVPPWSTLKHYD